MKTKLRRRIQSIGLLAMLLLGLHISPSHGYVVFQTLRHVDTGFDALDGVSGAVVSPDGRHLYVVGEESILVMEINPASGQPTPIQTLKQNALDGIRLRHVVMDPDGLNLYAGSYYDDALMVFSRHPTSGHLTHIQTLRSTFPDLLSLELLNDLVFSADGRFLYLAGAGNSALGIFRRHLGSGTLQLVDEIVGFTDLPVLQDPEGLDLSPEGDVLYVADRDGGLLSFARDTGDGSLTFQSVLGLDVLAPLEPLDVLVDPSGLSLYVSGVESDPDGYGSAQDLLIAFRREPGGGLTRIGTHERLSNSNGLSMDASGSHLYMTNSDTVSVFERSPEGQLHEIQRLERTQGASQDGAFDPADRFLYLPDHYFDLLAVIERNPASGEVDFVSTYEDGQGGTVDGLLDIEALYATADGHDVYTLTQENKAIAQFRRDADGVLRPGEVFSLLDLGLDPRHDVVGWLAIPNESFLLAVTHRGRDLWIFRRDADTGQLELASQTTLGSFAPRDITFSPDGRTLFVALLSELLVLDFDPATGLLSERTIFERPGQEFRSVVLDTSGQYLYVGSDLLGSGVGVIRAFLWERNPDRFTDVGSFQNPALGGEITAMVVTPDGRYLLATGEGDGAGLVVFERNPTSGLLTEIQTLVDGQDGLTGFRDPVLGSMDPSGVRLVVTSFDFSTPVTSTFLGRDPSTGLLEVLEQRTAGDSSRPSGIDSYGILAWSPEGRQFYAFSTSSDILFSFDESAQTACVPRPQVLCLGNAGRFRVEVQWTDFVGQQGIGTKVVESGDSGLFWFFDDANWEMLVKVVDGCGFNDHHWVFAAATTNVAYTLAVTDTLRGVEAVYQIPLGVSSAAITDTEALDSCP